MSDAMAIRKQRIEDYLRCHAACDLEGVLALFEVDAGVEDPVGSPVHLGPEAVRAFYAGTQATNGAMTIEPVGPILTGGDEMVLHVRAGLNKPGSPPPMDVIYVIWFGPSDRIGSLRAWYQPAN